MEQEKKCNHCGTQEELVIQKYKNRMITYNICKSCRKELTKEGLKYGHTKEAREKAKISITKYTKEVLINILQEAYKKYGVMRPTDFILKINKENNSDIRLSIKRNFETIEKALTIAGIDYKNYYWTNERIIKTLHDINEKFGPLYKVQINDFRRKRLICGSKLIRDRFGSIELAAAMAGFKFVEPQSVGHKFNGKVGKDETKILNQIEELYGIKLIRNYRIEIDGIPYFIDGYDAVYNVGYEVDDKYHSSTGQQYLDKVREEKIINKLNCQIIRIKNY